MKPPADSGVPLCVDLDGTLVRTDMLQETLVAALKRNPLIALKVPFWLLRGRAFLKGELAERATFDPALLPYDERTLELVREARAAGRRTVLATASDGAVARRIASHLGLFDEVLASDRSRNLKGSAKAALLVERFGPRGFDYAGNDRADLPVWAQGRIALVAARGDSLARAAAASGAESRKIERSPRSTIVLSARALRVYQWAKNLLVFVPVFTAHRLGDALSVQAAFLAFAAFSFAASAAYIVNDLADLDADRRHPEKRRRVFAAGELPVAWGLIAAPVLLVLAGAIAWMLPTPFAISLGVYLVATFAYTLWLKTFALVDVFTLAGLYGLRIVAGAAAVQVPLSDWLVAFSLFMFLSLALAKRHAELTGLAGRAEEKAHGRGYVTGDRALILAMGVASAFASLLVLALYITSSDVMALYVTPVRLWAIIPLMLFWISRVWMRAQRGTLNEDPVIFALRDPASLVVALGIVAGVVSAS